MRLFSYELRWPPGAYRSQEVPSLLLNSQVKLGVSSLTFSSGTYFLESPSAFYLQWNLVLCSHFLPIETFPERQERLFRHGKLSKFTMLGKTQKVTRVTKPLPKARYIVNKFVGKKIQVQLPMHSKGRSRDVAWAELSPMLGWAFHWPQLLLSGLCFYKQAQINSLVQ